LSEVQHTLKRTLDIVASLVVGGLSLPLLGASIAAMKLTMPGPILFRQRRVGLGGREFEVIKLRTMVVDAEKASGPVKAPEGDQRITPLGRWLRKYRVDEIPQLWNVLRGEMSFVGPRPERSEFVRDYEQHIPGYAERHRIKPGVTGLAQVNATYLTHPNVKLKYDLSYISNYSLLLDIQVIFLTVKLILTGRSEYEA
jgi:lipopolysaccharide/colanic/teichoic acid biosynthesis glycosyltransferase